MSGGFPFNGGQGDNNHPLRNHMRPFNIDEALYLQRQREIEHDFQVRHLLLQQQMDRRRRLQSFLFDNQNQVSQEESQQHQQQQQLLDRYLRGEYATGEGASSPNLMGAASLPRQEDLLREQQHSQLGPTGISTPRNRSRSEDGGPLSSTLESIRTLKDPPGQSPMAGHRNVMIEQARKQPGQEDRQVVEDHSAKSGKKRKYPFVSIQSKSKENKGSKSQQKETSHHQALNLLGFASATNGDASPGQAGQISSPPSNGVSPKLGRVESILEAAVDADKADVAAGTLSNLKANVDWSDSEDETPVLRTERSEDEQIVYPGFKSVLPVLPVEPEFRENSTPAKKKRKQRSILDPGYKDSPVVKATVDVAAVMEDGSQVPNFSDFQFPENFDRWFPDLQSIRKERKANGEIIDEDIFTEDPDFKDEDCPFRVNASKIRDKLANEVEPGVLEKLPHCQIHRQTIHPRKDGGTSKEFAFCFQVTELYPTEPMVNCSHCGTWRHISCGGHHKPFSVQEHINAPFVAVCDRCHLEEKILRDFPHARTRLDRQRNEQIRRGLCTSSCMRTFVFSKHGGTYKWPLGSVTETHIGGHTRSVHSRHDKAEKQWTDMANKFLRTISTRSKDRTRIRTKEFERLLTSLEDAESQTDRHNMLVFLMEDTLKKYPAGYEQKRRNIFDPADDEPGSTARKDMKATSKQDTEECLRTGCKKPSRFDSAFCSDACGISTIEADILRTFHYSSDIHPAVFRA